LKISISKFQDAEQPPSKNRQITISHYGAERVSQAFRPSSILDFKITFLMDDASLIGSLLLLFAGLLPLWSLFFEKMVDVKASSIYLPVTDMTVLSLCLVSACLAGVFVARRFRRFYYKLWQLYMPSLTLLTLAAVVVVNAYIYHPLFQQTTLSTLLFTVVLSVAGYASGLAVAYLARLTHSQQLTICIESGTRTTYVVSVLLYLSLAEPEAQLACLAPATCSLLSVSVSTVSACVYRVVQRRRASRRRLVDAQLHAMSDDVCDADRVPLQTRPRHVHSPRNSHDTYVAS